VVGGAEQAQVELGGARLEAGEVVGHAGGEVFRRGLVEHGPGRERAGPQFQREGAVAASDWIHRLPYAPVWKSRATPLS
jgi:hypothetical protein